MAGTTPVRAGLIETSFLKDHVRDGLQAMEKAHLSYIDKALRTEFADSLEIDENLKKGKEQENRWDYLLGHSSSGAIVGLEPHSANNHEVSTVINKRKQALIHLRGHLRDGVRVQEWFWVASGKVDFTPLDKKVTQLANNGITFVGTQLLAKRLAKLVPAAKGTSIKKNSAARRTKNK